MFYTFDPEMIQTLVLQEMTRLDHVRQRTAAALAAADYSNLEQRVLAHDAAMAAAADHDAERTVRKLCPSEVDAAVGDVRATSIGEVYPFIVVGIDNPSYIKREKWSTGIGFEEYETEGRHTGLFYYVQAPDGEPASYLFRSHASALQVARYLKNGSLPVKKYDRAAWARTYE